MLEWECLHFDQLDTRQLFTILAERQAVFVVEQDCPYQDADDYDLQSWHLLGWGFNAERQRELAAYARIIPPRIKTKELTIGRVITTQAFRGKGAGRQLLLEAVESAKKLYPNADMYLSAQAHLQRYYGEGGFKPEGETYLEDGIPHIAMYRRL